MKKSPLRIILFVAFVDLVGFGLIIPLQANYAERMGASAFVFGFVIGIYAAMQFIFNPILGRWSDRVGRRRILLVSMAGSALSHVLLGVADLEHSLTLLFIARILDGISGANLATAQAYIADITTGEDRAKGLGLFGAAAGFGFVVGPTLGSGLAILGLHVSGPEYGTAWPAFGAAVISGVACLLVWRLLPEPPRKVEAKENAWRGFALTGLVRAWGHPRLRELLFLTFMLTFAFVLLEVTFVYLCVLRFGVTERGTGFLFAYIGIVMVIVRGGLVGRLVPRFGEMRLLSTGPFITAIGFGVLSAITLVANNSLGWALLLLGCLIVPIGHGLTGPNLHSLISRQAPGGRQGAIFGLSQSMASLARAVSPPIGGLLFKVGPQWPYWVGGLLLAMLGLFALYIKPAQEAALATKKDDP